MHFKFLTELGDTYRNEVDEAPCQNPIALQHLADGFESLIDDLDELKQERDTVSVSAPKGKTVAELARFHEDRQRLAQRDGVALTQKIMELEKKIARQKAWLTRQGVGVNPDNTINWNVFPRKVQYDRDPVLQALTRVRFLGGRLFTDDAGRYPLDTSGMVTAVSGPGFGIFVLSAEGNIHVSSHSTGFRHHSSLLAGAEVASAGELQVKKGQLVWLSNKSGHYVPSLVHMLQILRILQKRGVLMTFPVKAFPEKKTYVSVGEYLKTVEALGEPYEVRKTRAYSKHLTPDVLAQNGWRPNQGSESFGVYRVADGQRVPYKDVRRWLKSTNRFADVAVQSGLGR